MSEVESQISTSQVGKEQYLARLSTTNKETVGVLSEAFRVTMQKMARHGALIAVGGALTKEGERKDLDFLLVLDPRDDDPKADLFLNRHAYAVEDFKIFEEVGRNIAQNSNVLEIAEVTPPTIDKEFNSSGILKSEGIIGLKRKDNQGTPIELIRHPNRGWKTEMQKERRNFSVVATV